MQLDETETRVIPLPSASTPSRTIIAVNILWFSSLVLSLFTALFGILVKQWLHVYSQWSGRASPRETLILRDFYQEGFHHWGVSDIIGTLPVVLQLALLLFAVGLVTYLWTLNTAVAGALTSLVTVMILIVVVTIVLPLWYTNCPYKSPVGLFFLRSSILVWLSNLFTGGRTARTREGQTSFSSWKDRDSDIATRAFEAAAVFNAVIRESCQVLDIHPHSELVREMDKESLESSLVMTRINGLPLGTPRLLLDLLSAKPTRFIDISDHRNAILPLRLLVFAAQLAKPYRSTSVTSAIVELCSKVQEWTTSNEKLLLLAAEHMEAHLTADKPRSSVYRLSSFI